MPNKGFSLIELLLSISILAIILAFIMPNYDGIIQQQKTQTIAKTLMHFLSEARQQAIYKNSTITVCPSQNRRQCLTTSNWANQVVIIFNDINANALIDINEEFISEFNISQTDATLLWKSFGNKPYLQWQSSGTTLYQNGNFTYCPGNKKASLGLKIILNAAGRIYFGKDSNNDGIQEGTDGKNMQC